MLFFVNDLKNKIITVDEIKEMELYLPRQNSVTSMNFFNSVGLSESKFKNIRNISYITMLNTIKNNDGIGLITKEYVEEELKNKQIIELKMNFEIKPIEYGIYINKENVFKELKELIKNIKNARYN